MTKTVAALVEELAPVIERLVEMRVRELAARVEVLEAREHSHARLLALDTPRTEPA